MSLKIDRLQLEIEIKQDKARQKVLELEQSMREANKALKDIKKNFGENSAEYKKQIEVIKQLQQQYDDLYDEIGLANLSIRELGKRQKELNLILRNLNPNSESYKRYREQLDAVNLRIKEIKGTATETRLSLSKLADGFNRYAALGAGVVASLTGVALTARKCVDEFAEMKEAESQVIKYTGMTEREVALLNEELKRMNTRTSREELNRLAGEAGRLGIQSREEVLKFVQAADMINVALGEDLGEDAIKNIGKLAQMFGDASRDMKGNMLAIGSAVNSVAQNSSAAEPYLVEFAARMGGVAKQAKMSITDVMGFASALDQNMLRSEMASTALQGLILKIYQEPAKYAKLAGLDVKKFSDLLATDVNEAVLTFLEQMNRLGGMDKMAPVLDKMSLSGAEAAGVISALAGNIEKVRKEQQQANQAYTDGTSIINEFGVQNSTVQAELDKAKKRFTEIRVELGEQLLPVMKYMVTTGSLTVKGLSIMISILMKYKATLATAVLGITAYTVATKGAAAADKLKVLWTTRVVTSMKSLFAVMRANPYVTILSAMTAMVAVLTDWRREAEKLTATERNLRDIRSKASTDIAVERKELQDLLAIARDETQSKETRESAIRRLNQLAPDYLGNLTLEKIKTEEATKAVNAYVNSLIAKQNIENANAKKNELLDQRADISANGIDEGFWAETNRGITYGFAKALDKGMQLINGYGDEWSKEMMRSIENRTADALRAIDNQVEDLDQFIEEERRKLLQQGNEDNSNGGSGGPGGGGSISPGDAFKAREEALKKSLAEERNVLKQSYYDGKISEDEYQSGLYQIQVKYIALRKKLLDEFGKDSSEIEGQLLDAMIAEANRMQQQDLAKKKENLKQEVDAENQSYKAKQIKLQNHYAFSKMSKEEYDRQMEQLELEHLKRLMNIKSLFGVDASSEESSLAGKAVDKKDKENEKNRNEGEEAIKRAKSEQEAMSVLDSMYKAGILSYEEYERTKTEIAQTWEDRRNTVRKQAYDTMMNLLQASSQLIQAMQDQELSKVQRRYDKQIKEAKKAGKDTTKLEEEKEQAMADVKKKYADKMFAMNVLQITATTAVTAMEAYKSMAGIPVVGPALGAAAAAAAVIAGAAQIAVAKKNRDEAKGLKSGGYSADYVEGYTDRGNPDDVAGVIPVHKNEFVTNHLGVANPHVRQFLDVFDTAQRNGTIGMINTTQILEQVRTRTGRYDGGFTEPASPSDSPSGTVSMDALLRLILETLRTGNTHLQTIAGKELTVDVRAVRDGIRRVDRLEANASR